MRHLRTISRILLASCVIPFSLLCAVPVVIFYAVSRVDAPDALERFVTVFTFGSHPARRVSEKGSAEFFKAPLAAA